MKNTFFSSVHLWCILFITVSVQINAENLLRNPGLEESEYSFSPWNEVSFAPGPVFTLEKKGAHGGKQCASLENKTLNDSRLVQVIPVDERTSYKVSGWIKTKNVSVEGGGAIISLNDFFYSSNPIRGTNNKWEYVEFYVAIEYQIDSLAIAMRLGNYGGECVGKAYYDDISVEKVAEIPAGVLKYTVGNPEKPGEQTQSQIEASPQGKTIPVSISVILTIALIILSSGAFSALFFIKKRANDNQQPNKDMTDE